jgi:hypothetical protein
LKKPKGKKFFYIQDGGTYSNEVLVGVGVNAEDIIRYVKRNGLNFSDSFPRKLRTSFNNEARTNASGRTLFDEGRSILWLPEWRRDWEHYETLMHEVWHLVHRTLVVNKSMEMEDEAQAYQLEYWFHNIREKLEKRYDARKKARKAKRGRNG